MSNNEKKSEKKVETIDPEALKQKQEQIYKSLQEEMSEITKAPEEERTEREKWILKAVGDAKERTLDNNKGQFSVEATNEKGELVFNEKEGIPVDDLIENLDEKYEKKNKDFESFVGTIRDLERRHSEQLREWIEKGDTDPGTEHQTKMAWHALHNKLKENNELKAEIDELRDSWEKSDGYKYGEEQFALQTGEAFRQIIERNKTLLNANLNSWDEMRENIELLDDNSESYEKLHPEVWQDPARLQERIKLEAYYISQDHRATGDPAEDYLLAEKIIKKRRELKWPGQSEESIQKPEKDELKIEKEIETIDKKGKNEKAKAQGEEHEEIENKLHNYEPGASGAENLSYENTEDEDNEEAGGETGREGEIGKNETTAEKEGKSMRYLANFTKIKERNPELSDREIHDFIKTAETEEARKDAELMAEYNNLAELFARDQAEIPEEEFEAVLKKIAQKTGIPLEDREEDGRVVGQGLRSIYHAQIEAIQNQAAQMARENISRRRKLLTLAGYGAASAGLIAGSFLTGGALLPAAGGVGMSAFRMWQNAKSGRAEIGRRERAMTEIRRSFAAEGSGREGLLNNLIAQAAVLKQNQIDGRDVMNSELDEKVEEAEQEVLNNDNEGNRSRLKSLQKERETASKENIGLYLDNLGETDENKERLTQEAIGLYRVDESDNLRQERLRLRHDNRFRRVVNKLDRFFSHRVMRGGETTREKALTAAIFTGAGLAAREVPIVRNILMSYAGVKGGELFARWRTNDTRDRYRILRQVRHGDLINQNSVEQMEAVRLARAQIADPRFKEENPNEHALIKTELDKLEQAAIKKAEEIYLSVEQRNDQVEGTICEKRMAENERKLVRVGSQIAGGLIGFIAPNLLRNFSDWIKNRNSSTPPAGTPPNSGQTGNQMGLKQPDASLKTGPGLYSDDLENVPRGLPKDPSNIPDPDDVTGYSPKKPGMGTGPGLYDDDLEGGRFGLPKTEPPVPDPDDVTGYSPKKPGMGTGPGLYDNDLEGGPFDLPKTEPRVPDPDDVTGYAPVGSAEKATSELLKPIEIKAGEGDSVWSMSEKYLNERFKDRFAQLDLGDPKTAEALKTYDIDRLKDVISADPEKYGLPKGVSFEKLSVEHLNKVDYDRAINDAFPSGDPVTGLTGAQVENIVRNNATLKEFFAQHPDTPRTAENFEKILRGEQILGHGNISEPFQSTGEIKEPSGINQPERVLTDENFSPDNMAEIKTAGKDLDLIKLEQIAGDSGITPEMAVKAIPEILSDGLDDEKIKKFEWWVENVKSVPTPEDARLIFETAEVSELKYAEAADYLELLRGTADLDPIKRANLVELFAGKGDLVKPYLFAGTGVLEKMHELKGEVIPLVRQGNLELVYKFPNASDITLKFTPEGRAYAEGPWLLDKHFKSLKNINEILKFPLEATNRFSGLNDGPA